MKNTKIQLGEEINGVQAIGMATLIEHLYGEDWYKVGYKESSKKVLEWIEENDAHYYAAVKEDFFPYSGSLEAIKAGKSIMVMDNLS